MNLKKKAMMLTIMLITILSASCFYVLTGENDIVNSINVKKTDYEKVYVTNENAPYTETDGTHAGKKYYIRYTGAATGRTVVDLKDETVEIEKNGQKISVKTGVKIGEDGYPYIFGRKIESTYKMFSKVSGSSYPSNDVTRVFVPSSIAITSNGISSNTFVGTSQEIDCIYHTGELSTNDKNLGVGLKENGTYDKTKIITQSNVFTYVYLETENFDRQILNLPYIWEPTGGQNQSSYAGTIKNVFVSYTISDVRFLFSRASTINSNYTNQTCVSMNKVLLDENGKWTNYNLFFSGQDKLDLSEKFSIPNENVVVDISAMFNATNIDHLPKSFKIPSCLKKMVSAFSNCYDLSGIIEVPQTVINMDSCLFDSGRNLSDEDNLNGYNAPIVLKYSDNCIPALAYKTNVKGLENNGKVYKQLYDWELVYSSDTDAPYEYRVDNQLISRYYIHYRGNGDGEDNITLDLDKDKLSSRENKDGKLKYINDELYILFGNETIDGTNDTGIKLTSTYKMFEKTNYDSNDKLYRVFIPSCIAIDSDLTKDSNKGIASNTFDKTTQDIDCIYHTGDITKRGCQINERGSGLSLESGLSTYNPKQFDFDRTDKIKNRSNVITYVYLGNENISRETAYYVLHAYNGSIKNCYVSSDIENINHLFYKYNDGDGEYSDGTETEIDYALMDTNKEWIKANEMFVSQYNLKMSPHFTLPNSLTNIWAMFYGCKSLCFEKGKQYEFTLPNHVNDIGQLFYGCEKFNGEITIPDTVGNMDLCFYLAGTSVNQIDYASSEHSTPIVMKYSDKCIPALAYRTNVKGLDTSENVYKKLYDWELVYSSDTNAPYEYRVDNQLISRYYIHYRGNGDGEDNITLDLDKDKLSSRENKDGKLKYINDELYILFGNETISGISDTGIKLTSTYKMFEKTNYDSNDKLYRVFIPSCIAIDSDLTKDSNKGIASNTFDKTTQDIDCIYHTGDITKRGCQINERGSGLSLDTRLSQYNGISLSQYNPKQFDFDRTDKIKNQSNVITYVYLGNENISRKTAYNALHAYNGGIKNCYVSADIDYINHLFYKFKDGDGVYSDGTETEINYALIDTNKGWSKANEMFVSQYNLKISPHFTLPNSLTNIWAMFFQCKNIYFEKGKQYEFTLPKNAEDIGKLFYECEKFNGTITIPYKVINMDECFYNAGTSVLLADYASTEHNKPIVANYYDDWAKKDTYVDNSSTNVYYNSIGNYNTSTSQSLGLERGINVGDDLSSTDGQENTDKVVITDETDYVTITVIKKTVDEVVDETQTTSQSVESVETENKENEKSEE